MHRFQRCGRWWIYQYVHPITGRRVKFRSGLETDCEAKRRDIENARAALAAGRSAAEVARELDHPDALTLATAWQTYLATRKPRARSKAEQYWRTTIDLPVTERDRRTLGAYLLAELTAATMGAWAMRLSTTGGRTGAGRAHATVKLAVDYLAAAIRMVGAEPAWGRWRPPAVAPPSERPWLRSLEELELLLAAAAEEDEQDWRRGRYACRWYLAGFYALTGVRNAEGAGLAWDSLELDREPPILVVRFQAPKGWTGERPRELPKGGRPHVQALHPLAADILRRQRSQLVRLGWYRPDGPVWPAEGGTWHRSGAALRPSSVRRWARKAGLQRPEEWCAHCLRHSFSSLEVVGSGGDLAATARRTGHADLGQLQRYVHALGVGLGTSAIPALTAPEFATLPTPAAPPVAPAPPRPPADSVPGPKLPPTFLELARAWLAAAPAERRGDNGQHLVRPRAITALARRRGAAAYAREWREAAELAAPARREHASRARRAAVKAVLARWARALAEATRDPG
jgi:integrase